MKKEDGLKNSYKNTFFWVLTWTLSTVAFFNVLYFVLRVSAPVIQADAWNVFDVFVRKAINGNLGFADFFVKRGGGGDHAQPLFKLIQLIEWRYFDLDYMFGAVLGVFAAGYAALIWRRILCSSCGVTNSEKTCFLVWAAICSILFSLNARGGTWGWPLVALENLTTLIILLYMLSLWNAQQKKRYVLLIISTLFLGISSDDSAVVAVISTVLALALAYRQDTAAQKRSILKAVIVVSVCMALVRWGYSYAPVHGNLKTPPMLSSIGLLPSRFMNGGWWKWFFIPLVFPIYYQNPFGGNHAQGWFGIQILVFCILFVAHGLFWRRAFRCKYNRLTFIAVSFMFLFYGWVAGIILVRVPFFGNDYLNQPRYVLLYSGHLVALLLMWADSRTKMSQTAESFYVARVSLLPIFCVIILLLQIPLSIDAWRMRPYAIAYYIRMAKQIDDFTRDPAQAENCLPEIPVCGLSKQRIADLTQMLSVNHLNIYSENMQRWHHYLPRLSPVPVASQPKIAVSQTNKLL